MADTKEEKERLSKLYIVAAIVESERLEVFSADPRLREKPKAPVAKKPPTLKP